MPEVTSAIVDTMGDPILVLERDATVLLANRAFYDRFGVVEDETVGRNLHDLGNGQWNIPELVALLEELHGKREIVRDYRVEHDFEGIGRRVMLLTGRLLEQEGSERILLAISDVTDRERRDSELAAQRELSDKLIDSVREGLVVLGSDLTVQRINKSFCEIFQVDPGEGEGCKIYELGNGQWDIPALREALEEILPQEKSFDDFKVVHDFPGIGHRTMLLNARRLDHMPLILLAIRDETEREVHAESQKLLVGELQHRVKNMLANVQSIAKTTARRSATLDEFREAYIPRLESMSRTQDLLLSGAEGIGDLHDIVAEELAAHGWTEDGRVALRGPSVTLPRNQAQAFAMVIHELATNAVKYGAFADPDGRLDVEWSVDGEGVLHLVWRESGVDGVAPPSKKGFGTDMIGRSVGYVLQGSSELDFAGDGVTCRLSFPLEGQRRKAA